jgi:cytochrome c-type biogenesis protein CcmH/NrfG
VLEAALRLEPRNLATLVRLGQLALQANDLTSAVDRFEEALFLRPTLALALQGLAEAFERQGRAARATTVRALIP